jgi:hypothetical protein
MRWSQSGDGLRVLIGAVARRGAVDDAALQCGEKISPRITRAAVDGPVGSFLGVGQNGRRLAQYLATPSEPVAVESSAAPTEARRSRWPWIIGLGTAAASLCVALIAVGVIVGLGNDAGSAHAAAPLTAIRSSARKAAPLTPITISPERRSSGRVVPRRR